jgi:putative ABC transport system permease protein
MFDLELVKRSLHTIQTFGVKSILTILGIIVAVTAIVALISIGNGFQNSINQQFQDFGTNTLIVLPGRTLIESPFSTLNEEDAKIIQKIPRISIATPIRVDSIETTYKMEKKNSSIIGLSKENIVELNKIGILNSSDGALPKNNGEIIIGYRISTRKFDNELRVGNQLKINGENFKIVGIMGRQKNFMASQFSNSIIMLESDFKKHSNALPSRIFVQFNKTANFEDIKTNITRKLKSAHGEEDFQILDSKQLIESSLSIMGIIQIIVVGIASIALIVGAIGVMNMMFMSVSNRIKEIGIMKSIGATNQQVRAIFLMEALLIGIIGGVVGAIFGTGIALATSIIAQELEFTLNPSITIELILFAIIFAGSIGIISGIIPAIYASKLDPVEAIRK